MKAFTFPPIFLAILGTAYEKVIESEDTLETVDPFAIEDCWYKTNPHDRNDTKFMCQTAGGVLQNDGGDYSTPQLCQAKCVALGPGKVRDGGCNHWAFTNVRNSDPHCYAIDECYEDVHNHCTPAITDDATCASGPRECDKACDKLDYVGGLDRAHWDCLHNGASVHPYQDDIPSGAKCTAECPGWKDSVNQSVTSVSAICKKDGTWEVPTPAVNPPIGKPNDDPNPACACDPIKIAPATFEATDNLGADLYCTDENGDGDLLLKNEAFTIQKMMNCIFMCDKQFVMEVECTRGTWTAGIKDCTEFYCWNQPTEEECSGS